MSVLFFCIGTLGGSIFTAVLLHTSGIQLVGLIVLGLLAGAVFCGCAGEDMRTEEMYEILRQTEPSDDYHAGYADGYADGQDDLAESMQFSHPAKVRAPNQRFRKKKAG